MDLQMDIVPQSTIPIPVHCIEASISHSRLRHHCSPAGGIAVLLKSVSLIFFVAEPYLLHTVTHAVNGLLDGTGSSLERLEMDIWTDQVTVGATTLEQRRLFEQRFQSLFDAYSVPSRGLTSLTLQNLSFEEDVISGLLSSCTKMHQLSLSHCDFGATSNSNIWVEPEEPTQLCYTFNNLRDLYLQNITAT
uniref:Uncharacterized protein n=1 Tax=Oryza punctata TaxID=4537 RepID=A0A0E0L3Q5_ORYPU